MRLSQLAKAVQQGEVEQGNHSVLLYGGAKAGKTELAATAAESPDIDRVFMFDNENGHDTLISMMAEGRLSDEAAEKIIIIPINDTRAKPYAIETMLKVLNSVKSPVYIDLHTGRVLKQKPVKVGEEEGVIEFQISKLTSRDAILIDSLSQLGDSAINGTYAGKDYAYKAQLDDWGLAGKWLIDCLTIAQEAAYCHFVCVTHEVIVEGEDGRNKLFPLCGSSKISPKVGKYFGTVAYVEKKGRKHVAGSGSMYSPDKVTGSRRGIRLEDMETPSLKTLFSKDFMKQEDKPKGKGTALASRLKK